MVRSYPKIVALGDSLVQGAFGPYGWGSALSSDYAGKFDVLNRGMGGYNSRWILRKLKEDWYAPGDPALEGLPSEEIKLVIIHLGTNDSCSNSGQHVPIDEFKSNLLTLITHFRTLHSSQIILLTPSTIDPPAFLTFVKTLDPSIEDTGHTNELHRAYADAVIEVAEEKGVGCVDLFELFEGKLERGECEGRDLFLEGLHYAPQGYATITHALRHHLSLHLPHLTPPSIRQDFPPYFVYGPDPYIAARIGKVVEKIAPGVPFDEGLKRFERMRAVGPWEEVLKNGDKL